MSPINATSEYRLPTDVKPTHYDLTVRTDLDKLVFDGFVIISLDIRQNTDTIVLNSFGLNLGKASVTPYEPKGSCIAETKQIVCDHNKQVAFQFPNEFRAGWKVKLQVGFSAHIGDGMFGYHRSTWELDGKTKYYALTQFAPIDARRAFPCWDEPALKATFAITQISRANTTNISNMSVAEEKAASAQDYPYLSEDSLPLDSDWKVTRYETTPPMSTYLVAFANGEFAHLETSVAMPLSGRTIPLRIYTTQDIIHQAHFALEVKAKVLPLYEEIFQVAYPLPKLDTLVASDSDGGAMENWGLIAGATRAFLIDPNNADVQAKRIVIKIMSHEVGHMWFGNITTMEWWDYLYLNEGFATLMGDTFILDRTYPEFKPNPSFINDHVGPALALDAKPSSHPIEVEIPNPDYICMDAAKYALSYRTFSVKSVAIRCSMLFRTQKRDQVWPEKISIFF
ncbi:Aminopeptidase 2 mitochondrial [Marasmius tenuissimus]|nr:Aminopeptidase 2 mitochondrial [Marasmius tenuissimus]